MADTNWGETMGSQLMAGFVQGRKMQMEKKRLALAEKEQTQVNDFRIQQLAQQEAEMKTQQAQYAEQALMNREKMDFAEKKLETDTAVAREKIESNYELKKSYEKMVEARYGGQLNDKQKARTVTVGSEMTKQVLKIMTDHKTSDRKKFELLQKVAPIFAMQIKSLGLPPGEEEAFAADVKAKTEEVVEMSKKKEKPKGPGGLGMTWQFIKDSMGGY